jgi:thiol-disulfide isomerase/thioredoxin
MLTTVRIVGLLCLGALLLPGCRPAPTPPGDPAPPPIGIACPPLTAAGWVNGPAPSPSDISGHLVVIDCWGHWCAPCRATAPRLVKLYEEFAPQHVLFVGLTADGVEALNEIKTHLAHLKIPWPNGYGAADTLAALGVSSLPLRLVVGRDGRVIWRGAEVEPIREVLRHSLDTGPQPGAR